MNSKLEALISAYQVKPKKPGKKHKKPATKATSSEQTQKLEILKPSSIHKVFHRKSRRENLSVQPKRSESTMLLGKYLNTSFEEDMNRLELLTNKNSDMRLDWLNIKQKVIELNTNKKLIPIAEIDENSEFYNNQPSINKKKPTGNFNSFHSMKVTEKVKSMDSLLLNDKYFNNLAK